MRRLTLDAKENERDIFRKDDLRYSKKFFFLKVFIFLFSISIHVEPGAAGGVWGNNTANSAH